MDMQNKPVHVIRCGCVKAACWLDGTTQGYFYNTKLSKFFRDRVTDEWGDSSSFSDRDLLAVAHAAQEMYRWICQQKASANVQSDEDS